MYEFEVLNIHTSKEAIIFGHSMADACRRAGYNVKEWKCIYRGYID